MNASAKSDRLLEALLTSTRLELANANTRVQEVAGENDRLKRRITELETQIENLQKRTPLEIYLDGASAARRGILQQLQVRLKIDFPNLMIEISAESDALRFQGEGLFKTGESVLHPEPLAIVNKVATRLNEILPSYTFGKDRAWTLVENPKYAVIEAVQIEGHTDSRGSPLSNLHLSTDRANSTFTAMLQSQPVLLEHLNYRGQPVMSVAGYGQMRPVATNDTEEGRATNRRIDLRIIMHTPASSEEIETIKKRLSAGDDRRSE